MGNYRLDNKSNIRTEIARCAATKVAAEFKIDGEPGLWLRVSPKGVAAWSLFYRPKGQTKMGRYGLGRFPTVTLSDARDMARVWMGKISEGIDPRDVLRNKIETAQKLKDDAAAEAAAKAARITVADAVERFLVAKVKARAVYHMGKMLQRDLVAHYGAKALADITRADIENIQQRILDRGAPRQADNVLSTIRSLLSWAKAKRHITENVAARFERVQKHGEGIRERKLTAAELRALWLVLDRMDSGLSLSMRRAFRLTMLLGQRIGEIGGMRKGELSPDLMMWTIPAERMKAKKVHVLPLPPMARAVIAEAMDDALVANVFSMKSGKPPATTSLSHAMHKLQHAGKRKKPLLAFTDANGEPSVVKLHDLRRTMATAMQHLGVRMEVIKAVLAHTALDDVTRAHYAQSALCREVREALTLWQATLTRIVRGEDPFAFRAEDAAEMERRILGQDQRVTAEAPSAVNVILLRAAG